MITTDCGVKNNFRLDARAILTHTIFAPGGTAATAIVAQHAI